MPTKYDRPGNLSWTKDFGLCQRLLVEGQSVIQGLKKQLERDERRISELKRLSIKIYEDNASGKFSTVLRTPGFGRAALFRLYAARQKRSSRSFSPASCSSAGISLLALFLLMKIARLRGWLKPAAASA